MVDLTEVLDLRSDTVTQPDTEMRAAMASAVVGDDVYREDPTVRELEALAAEILGTEAALFVASGMMGNQVCLHVHGTPGAEVVAEASSHIFRFEMGAMAALSGLQARPIPGVEGRLAPDDLERSISPRRDYISGTALLVIENTHNLAGGTVLDRSQLDALQAVARRGGLRVHLDGARLFNAAVALGVAPSSLVVGFDSAMVCLSKGLGAPVGSLVAGSEAFIEEARRVRRLFGGGMRQVGILAAAGLVALRRGWEHLAEDHNHARKVAEALDQLPGVRCEASRVATNIVVADCKDPSATVEALHRAGILAISLGPSLVRCVTHRDVNGRALERALERLLG